MFYVEVQDNRCVAIVPEGTKGSVAIDDAIENYDKYIYDSIENKVVKRPEVNYEVGEEDGVILITFNTDDYLLLYVNFHSEINGNSSTVSVPCILESIDGKATMRLTTLLSGSIIIEPSENGTYFDVLLVESTERIDNEYNPSISINGNNVSIEPSVSYNRFRTLQQEIDLLRKEFGEFRTAAIK